MLLTLGVTEGKSRSEETSRKSDGAGVSVGGLGGAWVGRRRGSSGEETVAVGAVEVLGVVLGVVVVVVGGGVGALAEVASTLCSLEMTAAS